MIKPRYITVKDIASMLSHLNVSIRMVRSNEAEWGLRPLRKKINKRVIMYREDLVVKALIRAELLDSAPAGTAVPVA